MTTKIYRPMTLNEFIRELENLPPEAEVSGFLPSVDSYRGYYERNAVAPERTTYNAHLAADMLRDYLGRPTVGYKGGEYTVDGHQRVYLAGYGDTGPVIVGLEEEVPGKYGLVTVAERW